MGFWVGDSGVWPARVSISGLPWAIMKYPGSIMDGGGVECNASGINVEIYQHLAQTIYLSKVLLCNPNNNLPGDTGLYVLPRFV